MLRYKTKKFIPLIILWLIVFSLILAVSYFNSGKVLSASDTSVPHTPQGFSVKARDGSLELSWDANAEWDIFSYKIYWRSESKPQKINSKLVGNRTNYLLENLKNGTTYFVSLSVLDSAQNESKPTPEISITPVAKKQKKEFKVAAWMPTNWDIEDARDSFEKNLDIWNIISPFWYSLREDGGLSKKKGAGNPHLINLAKKNNILVIPTITNNFDKKKTSKVLNDPHLLDSHIENVYNEVMIRGYDGIDIDYENIKPEDKFRFLEFIRKLANKLHSQNKLISVTSQPKKSDMDNWSGPGAMDYTELGKMVDQFRVMTYDFHRMGNIPGPISPPEWIKEVIEYTKSKVPKEKILVGIPFYGYDWCISGAGTDGGIVWDGVQNILKKYKPTLEWDDKAKEPWLLYVDDQKNTQVIYFQNARSISYKLDMVKNLDVEGISIWRLGSEDPEIFSVIREKMGKKINGSVAGLKITPQDKAINLEWENSDPEIQGYRIYFRREGEINEKFFDVWQKNQAQIYNLENGVRYYINLAPLGDQGKLGKKSKEVSAFPQDLAYPGTIFDLKIEKIGTNTLDLSWTTPGDEFFKGKAEKFDIRVDTKEITEKNFKQAKEYWASPKPGPAGTKQKWQIRNLEPGLTYWVAIKTIDESKNESFISNVIKATTLDNIAPQIPQGFKAKAKDSKIILSWKKNSEKDLAGYKIYFKQEKSFYDIVEVNKDVQEYVLEDLENGKRYFVSLSAFDRTGNESERTEDIKLIPRKGNIITKAREIKINQSQTKIRASLVSFIKKIINKEALPYLILFAVIIINFFVYKGLKDEINRNLGKSF